MEETPVGIAGKNTGSVCIEIIGDFDEGKDVLSGEQRDSIVEVYALLCRRFSIEPRTDTVLYHTWFASKTCPGTNFFGGNSHGDAEREFYPDIREAIRSQISDMETLPSQTASVTDKAEDLADEFFTTVAIWNSNPGAQSDAPSFWERVAIVLGMVGVVGFLAWFYNFD